MSNRFLNDHSVRKVRLSKILKITAGGSHCWCDSNVGVIRKPSRRVPEFLWDTFLGKKSKIDVSQITSVKMDSNIVGVKKGLTYRLKEEKPKWWRRLWNWFKGQIQNIIKNQKR